MASPSDDQQASNLNSLVYQRILSQFRGDWVTRLSVDQMFILIDGVLPFEACLYYQVLPLFLEGNRLHLGMVSPDDIAASEYVRRIISYLNYSLICHPISSEALRVTLTAYLNYVGNQQTRRETLSYGHHRHPARKVDRATNPNERLTLVVDSPDDLYEANNEMIASPTTPPTVEAARAPSANAPVSPPPVPQPAPPSQVNRTHAQPESRIVREPAQKITPQTSKPRPECQLEPSSPQPAAGKNSPDSPATAPRPEIPPADAPAKPLLMLQVEAKHLASPVEVLATLPPQELVQELLARVLLGGIGRLYFECYPQFGRVVWSQNGVLQSVLDKLTLPVFQGVIQELKTIACVSRLPVTQPQQAEIEYLYDRSGVLLRFRFMPGQHGEEATVQVLRGAALKFYQQQQLNKLERDAMTIAKQLQNKLNEIRVRAYSDPSLLEPKFEMLPKLGQVLQNIEHQLDDLGVDKADS